MIVAQYVSAVTVTSTSTTCPAVASKLHTPAVDSSTASTPPPGSISPNSTAVA